MAKSSRKPGALKGVRFYVVESDPVDQRIISYLLGELGADTYSFIEEFETAILVSKMLELDIIISDWVHPRQADTDVLALHKNDETISGIPLILVSADNRPSSREYALREGARAFLTKPIYLKELEQAIIRCLWPDQRV